MTSPMPAGQADLLKSKEQEKRRITENPDALFALGNSLPEKSSELSKKGNIVLKDTKTESNDRLRKPGIEFGQVWANV